MKTWDADQFDLAEAIRPGDGIVWGQACGEPLTLTEALAAQRGNFSGITVFIGTYLSESIKPEHADHIRITGYGGINKASLLTKAGVLAVRPIHVSQIAPCIEQGLIECDVAMVQISRPNERGEYSYGVCTDYIQSAVAKARVVIAEMNEQVPFTYGDAVLRRDDIDFLVETSRPLAASPPAKVGDVERAIARHIEAFIPDGATLQVGIGAIPDAIIAAIGNRRDLGIHSGMIGDSVADLIERGVVTNAKKPFDTGISITGNLIGTERLFKFAHHNPAIGMRHNRVTHAYEVLSRLPDLISINSAVEVDLTGQVNSEEVRGVHVGAVGGQVDFVRGAVGSKGGHSIIALPANAPKGQGSRILPRLAGSVSTARSDVDMVVTEFGVAHLRGKTLAARAKAMIAIAAPQYREQLEREAHALLKTLR